MPYIKQLGKHVKEGLKQGNENLQIVLVRSTVALLFVE